LQNSVTNHKIGLKLIWKIITMVARRGSVTAYTNKSIGQRKLQFSQKIKLSFLNKLMANYTISFSLLQP